MTFTIEIRDTQDIKGNSVVHIQEWSDESRGETIFFDMYNKNPANALRKGTDWLRDNRT